MGDRRMISRKIIESARFLKMPITSQNLYFHLIVNADDDGVVEAYPVLALCKANEDDLRVLMGKQFVHVLNDDLVTYIEDWREQNALRADRKNDSRYRNLLLQRRPDVQLLERKARSDTKKNMKGSALSVDDPLTAQPNLIESKSNQQNLTEQNITEKNSIYPSLGEILEDREMETKSYRELIAENIRLDLLLEQAELHNQIEKDMVWEIYEIICDMVCNPREKVTIKQTEYQWTVVKAQYLKLRNIHISNILNRIVDADLKIKNMNAYLVSTLYSESMCGRISEQAELHDNYLKELRGEPYKI